MTTELGYGCRPPGAYTAARATGISRRRTTWPCGSTTSRSCPTPSSATARTFASASSSPRRTAGSSASSASASSPSGTRSGPAPPPKRRSWSSSASSPPSSTEAMIPATTSWTATGARIMERTCAATAATSSRATANRSTTERLPQPRHDVVDLGRPQLVGHGIGDQARGRGEDLLAHDQAVLAQRRSGGGQVDDPLGEAGERRELDRALDLDDLRLAAGALEVARGDAGVLRRDPHHPEATQRLRGTVLPRHGRDDHHAWPDPEVEQLVDRALGLLGEDVLPRDAEVGGAGLDVRGDVRRAHRDEPDVLEEQLAVVDPHLGRVDAEP